MPPAFVLSQNQTLMFNPCDKPSHLSVTQPAAQQGPSQRLPPRRRPSLSTKPTPLAQTATTPPPPAHPFLLPNNVNQQSRCARRRIRPRREERPMPRSRRSRTATTRRPWRRVNLVRLRG